MPRVLYLGCRRELSNESCKITFHSKNGCNSFMYVILIRWDKYENDV